MIVNMIIFIGVSVLYLEHFNDKSSYKFDQMNLQKMYILQVSPVLLSSLSPCVSYTSSIFYFL